MERPGFELKAFVLAWPWHPAVVQSACLDVMKLLCVCMHVHTACWLRNVYVCNRHLTTQTQQEA